MVAIPTRMLWLVCDTQLRRGVPPSDFRLAGLRTPNSDQLLFSVVSAPGCAPMCPVRTHLESETYHRRSEVGDPGIASRMFQLSAHGELELDRPGPHTLTPGLRDAAVLSNLPFKKRRRKMAGKKVGVVLSAHASETAPLSPTTATRPVRST